MPKITDLNIFCKNLSMRLVGKELSAINIIIPRKLKVPELALKQAVIDRTPSKVGSMQAK
jgi:formamidopyrimidine-DNA glycosylase